jgi:hypothetical protein
MNTPYGLLTVCGAVLFWFGLSRLPVEFSSDWHAVFSILWLVLMFLATLANFRRMLWVGRINRRRREAAWRLQRLQESRYGQTAGRRRVTQTV